MAGPAAPAAVGTSTRLPAQFGKYSILGHLATGGMAEVYIARQAGLQGFEKIVVIKRIRPELIGDIETTSHFLDEARLVASLEHPNIAQVYEIGLVGDSYFFVMEYVHGADLRHLLTRASQTKQAVPLADAIYICSHVCSALHYAHEKTNMEGKPLHIIHRDVTPSNILMSHDGAVKLCDFGIAKATGRSAQTVRGVLKGKFAYMSPEQCRGEELDRRSDVFSMGIVLYELTTMSRLFTGDNDFELLRSIIEKPVPVPSSRVLDYPPQLEKIVLKALAKDPNDRYPTAQAMQLELEEFAREHRLGMSSVNIQKLMGSLFEKRTQAWQNAQKSGTGLADHLMNTATRDSKGELPVFTPYPDDPEVEVQEEDTSVKTPAPEAPAKGQRRTNPSMQIPPVQVHLRRASPLWLIGAVLAGAAAAAISVGGNMLAQNGDKQQKQALQGDVDRLASALESTARSAHMRADSIAGAPMVRAAIETDAATMKDLADHEYVFTVAKGEELEIFQNGKQGPKSMLRLPAAGAALAPINGDDTRVDVKGDNLALAAGAPVMGTKASGGQLVLEVPVDLATIKRSFGEHATSAALVGAGSGELPLVAGKSVAGPQVKIALTSSAPWAAVLSVVATPIVTASLDWVPLARYSCAGLAGVLVLGFMLARRKASRENARAADG